MCGPVISYSHEKREKILWQDTSNQSYYLPRHSRVAVTVLLKCLSHITHERFLKARKSAIVTAFMRSRLFVWIGSDIYETHSPRYGWLWIYWCASRYLSIRKDRCTYSRV